MSKMLKDGQNWHYRSCFKSLKDKKNGIVVVSPTNSKAKNVKSKERRCSSCCRTKMVVLERKSLTSL